MPLHLGHGGISFLVDLPENMSSSSSSFPRPPGCVRRKKTVSTARCSPISLLGCSSCSSSPSFDSTTLAPIACYKNAGPYQRTPRTTHALSFHRIRKITVLLLPGRKDGRYRRCSVSQQRHRSLVLPEQLILSGQWTVLWRRACEQVFLHRCNVGFTGLRRVL